MGSTQDEDVVASEAVFAGGCFWCMESIFQPLEGVIEVISGYTGGDTEDPTYEDVSTGRTGHFEAVLVRYNPEQVSYQELLDVFWRHIDPTDAGGQFHDRGSQYRTAIFTANEEEKGLAELSKQTLQEAGVFSSPIVRDPSCNRVLSCRGVPPGLLPDERCLLQPVQHGHRAIGVRGGSVGRTRGRLAVPGRRSSVGGVRHAIGSRTP